MTFDLHQAVLAALSVPVVVVCLLVFMAGACVWGLLKWAGIHALQTRMHHRVDNLRQRYRTLESILAVSARINATRDLPELQGKIAAAAGEVMGFRRVILYVWSEVTESFEARSFVGHAPADQDALAAQPLSRAEYESWALEENRYSQCFLTDAEAAGGGEGGAKLAWLESGRGGPRSWQDSMRLLAPLAGQSGGILGFLELENPAHGRVPSLVEIRQLEFLLKQSATAMESAEVYDSLARRNADMALVSEKMNSLADMKKNFVANVSHELRTPLTSISAYTELLQKNLNTLSPEAREEFLQVIHSESLKLSGIINDILELSQIENGRPTLDQVETDLAGLVRHLQDSWAGRAAERNIDLRVEMAAPAVTLAMDSMLIQQMLTHLVGNAFKFTPEGGQVSVALREQGTAVAITVEDTGIGIPADKLEDIFDKFFQVDGSATRRHNGQGVGLAICRDIVVHHDGRIWAENLHPSGTRFTVLLPRRPAVLQPSDPQSLTSQPFEAGEFMQRLVHWVSESLGVQVATLMVPDRNGDHLSIRAAIGLPNAVVQSAQVLKGTGFAGRVWETGQTLLVADVTRTGRFAREINEPRYTTPSLLVVPLLDKDEVVGIISVNNKTDRLPLDNDDRLFLESLAPRIAALLTRYEAWQDGARHFEAVRRTLRSTTAVGHARHESLLEVCQEVCLATARSLDLSSEELAHLAFSLQFYDVGLDRVPPGILQKPGLLTLEERRFVQEHVGHTLGILEPLALEPKVKQVILHHHENFDGSGYPAGLSGEAIPRGARLVRLADSLAALLSHRPWRAAMILDDALGVIRAGIGQEYCPRLAPIFLAEIEHRRDRIIALQMAEAVAPAREPGREAADQGVPVLN